MLKEQLADKSTVGCRARVAQKLLHTEQELGGFPVPKLFGRE